MTDGDSLEEATALDPQAAGRTEERFNQVASDWLTATGHLSSIRRKLDHPLYRELVSMGEPAVPLILKAISRRPSRLVRALADITREDPADRASAENILDVIQAWITWGRDRGYEV
jgi:hypothetical protein